MRRSAGWHGAPLRRLERRHLPPEGSALSTELQGHRKTFYPKWTAPSTRTVLARRKELEKTLTKPRLGWALITVGVLAWVPYFALQFFTELEPPMLPFLIVHLIGVIGGGWLSGGGWLRRLFKRQ